MSLTGGVSVIKSSAFHSNRAVREVEGADSFGGAIASSTPLTMSKSNFQLNFADDWGGAIALDGDNAFNFTNIAVIDNAATGGGGGIDCTAGVLTITKSRFLANQSMGTGGAIRTGDTVTNIATTIILGNIAANGGGIHASLTKVPTLAPDVFVEGNIAGTNLNVNYL